MTTATSLADLHEAIAAEPSHSGRHLSRHDAYRQFWCMDCRLRPYSAGRIRCSQCHEGRGAGQTPLASMTAEEAA